MKILITLCARGGSKGIPQKNIKPVAGKPLIAYSIETAQKFAQKYACDIILSTDNQAIKEVSAKFGLYSDYLRPDELATDSAGKLDVIKDVLHFAEIQNNIRYDYVLDLDITSPLRTLDDLLLGFEKLLNSDKINLFSVNPAHRNPYFNMVEELNENSYALVKQGHFLTRQSAPKVYDLNASFYFYKRNFFEQEQMRVISENCTIYAMPHICFDLDEPIDYEFLSFLLENNKLNFEL